MTMRISPNGLHVTKYFESCKLQAYLCPAGVWTIGYGHTGPDVHKGMTITQQRAEELLEIDIRRFESAVGKMVARAVSQGQFDALVDFAFNKGSQALAGSSLLRKLNAGDFSGAADEFLRWIYGGDGTKNGIDDDGDGLVDEPGERQRLRGLVRRALAQRALFLGHDGRKSVAIGVGDP